MVIEIPYDGYLQYTDLLEPKDRLWDQPLIVNGIQFPIRKHQTSLMKINDDILNIAPEYNININNLFSAWCITLYSGGYLRPHTHDEYMNGKKTTTFVLPFDKCVEPSFHIEDERGYTRAYTDTPGIIRCFNSQKSSHGVYPVNALRRVIVLDYY